MVGITPTRKGVLHEPKPRLDAIKLAETPPPSAYPEAIIEIPNPLLEAGSSSEAYVKITGNTPELAKEKAARATVK
jgi:hypothetical protein